MIRKTLFAILLLLVPALCWGQVARIVPPVDSTQVATWEFLNTGDVYLLGWGMQAHGDTAKPNILQAWQDSLEKMVYEKIDSTTATVPVADDVDTTGTDIAAAFANAYTSFWAGITDSTWMALGAIGDSLWAHLDDTSGVLRTAITDTTWAMKTQLESKGFVILNIAAANDLPVLKFPRAITIDSVFAKCEDGTNVVGALDEYNYGGSAVDAAIDADWTITTTQYVDGSFTNAGLDAGDWLGWHTTSVSGTVTRFVLTIYYHEN